MDLRGVYVWTIAGNERYWKWIARGDGENSIFTSDDLLALLQAIYPPESRVDLRYKPDLHPRILVDQYEQQYVGAWRDPMRPGYKRTLAQLNQKPLVYTSIVEAAQALPPPAPEPEPFVITDLDLDLDL